mmetsp:Transcript_87265/g.232604  ORF Transcript_87265/g.232604 Transcript_87265/m.232604 type:complete len:95 (-) Transcript_87265:56-340(-)
MHTYIHIRGECLPEIMRNGQHERGRSNNYVSEEHVTSSFGRREQPHKYNTGSITILHYKSCPFTICPQNIKREQDDKQFDDHQNQLIKLRLSRL